MQADILQDQRTRPRIQFNDTFYAKGVSLGIEIEERRQQLAGIEPQGGIDSPATGQLIEPAVEADPYALARVEAICITQAQPGQTGSPPATAYLTPHTAELPIQVDTPCQIPAGQLSLQLGPLGHQPGQSQTLPLGQQLPLIPCQLKLQSESPSGQGDLPEPAGKSPTDPVELETEDHGRHI